ncbi:UDP-N-acetylmuramate dehydrogenase [Fundidesulfovibrio butyratiphilus]
MALKVLPGPKLSERTTLRLGGRVQGEIVVTSPEDAAGLDHALPKVASRALMLGWGSNLLAADRDLDLALVTLPGAMSPEVVRREGDAAIVRIGGGFLLPKLINWAGAHGLSGLENLTGIPGSVGGAVAMNAGSYGTQTADVLERVRVWSADGGVTWLAPDQWKAGYRSFTPVGPSIPWLVLEAEYRLASGASQAIAQACREVMAKKKATQPVNAATCGCAFKNPEGDSAGRMLDLCGFKGKSVGGMAFSTLHANFLVNLGAGTSDAALELLARAREAVKSRFGVELELEVRTIA